jgi:hypothetical protein
MKGWQLGPLDAAGRVPAWQQTRLAGFLLSAYGALARGAQAQALLASGPAAVALQQQAAAAVGLAAALWRGTAWVPDWWVPLRAPFWEAAWLPLPHPPPGDRATGMAGRALDSLALGLAIETVLRPAPLLPPDAATEDGFAAALGLIELESARLVQPNLRLLKLLSETLSRAPVEAAVEARRAQLAALWESVLAGVTRWP